MSGCAESWEICLADKFGGMCNGCGEWTEEDVTVVVEVSSVRMIPVIESHDALHGLRSANDDPEPELVFAMLNRGVHYRFYFERLASSSISSCVLFRTSLL